MKKLAEIIGLTALILSGTAPARAQYHGAEATPGNCQVAVIEARQNGNVWNAPFSLDDCKAVAAKMIDDGYKAMRDSMDDGDRGRRRRRGGD